MPNSPQLENGYLKIANELFDALVRHRIPGEQRQCLDFILRKTYGFRKVDDRISNSQFVQGTGLKPGNVSRSIKALINKNIVIKNDNTTPPKYRINKKYWQWRQLSKTIKKPLLSKVISGVIKSDNIKSDNNPKDGQGLNPQNSNEIATSKNKKNGQNQESGLLSKVMDTKYSNKVTKERGTPKNEKNKKLSKQGLLARMKILSSIVAGNKNHTIVGNYGHIGETFPEMQTRARRELETLKRDFKN